MDNWNNDMDNQNMNNMGNMGGMGGDFNNRFNYGADTQNNGETPGFVKYLILSILETLCCCQIAGIIGIVFTVLFNSAYKSGNIADFESKQKIAKVVLLIGLGIGIVANLIVGLLYGASIMGVIMGA